MTDSTYRYAVDLRITGNVASQEKAAAWLETALAGTDVKINAKVYDARSAHYLRTAKDAMACLEEIYHHLKNNHGRPDRDTMERARDVIRDATTLQFSDT